MALQTPSNAEAPLVSPLHNIGSSLTSSEPNLPRRFWVYR